MTDSRNSHVGGCLCGAIRYLISGPARNLCLCHCQSCRRSAGAPFVAWGTVDIQYFKLTGGTLSIFRSSGNVQRGHCANCGSTLTYSNDKRCGEIDVALASLDLPERLAPRMEIFTAERLSWLAAQDSLRQFDTVPSAESRTADGK